LINKPIDKGAIVSGNGISDRKTLKPDITDDAITVGLLIVVESSRTEEAYRIKLSVMKT